MVRAVFRALGREYLRNEIPLRSAGICYFLFFALIPIMTTLVSVVLSVPFLQVEGEQVMEHLARNLLPEAIHEVKSHFTGFAEHARAISLIGTFVSIYLLSKIVFFFEESLNRFWRLEARRSPFRLMKKALLIYLLAILGVAAGTALPDRGVLVSLAKLVITWALFLGFNRIIPAWPGFPYAGLGWKSLLPGSLVCGSLWYVSKWGFTAYLERFAAPDPFPAVLGILPLFLAWLYFSVYQLLFSACLNCVLRSAIPPKAP